jgi:hypothetical protein
MSKPFWWYFSVSFPSSSLLTRFSIIEFLAVLWHQRKVARTIIWHKGRAFWRDQGNLGDDQSGCNNYGISEVAHETPAMPQYRWKIYRANRSSYFYLLWITV